MSGNHMLWLVNDEIPFTIDKISDPSASVPSQDLTGPHTATQDLPRSCEHRTHTEPHRTHKSHRTPHRTHRTSQDLTGPPLAQVLYRILQNPTEPPEGSVQNPTEPSRFWAQNLLAGVYAV